MLKVRNKWNGKIYTVLDTGSVVTLKRDDDTVFSIEVKEFKFSYAAVRDN